MVPGGVTTLAALARELKATERAVAERVRYQLRGSYSACGEDWCRILSHLVRSGHALTTQVLAPPRLPKEPTVFKSVRNSLSAAAL